MRTSRTWEERLSAAADRIEARLDRTGECWLWPGGTNGRGYGELSVKTGNGRESRSVYVHRVMYERHVGPIPPGMEIDHLCRVRNCGRPSHMESVTHAENVARAAALVVACPRGHAYSPANTSVRGGKRICLTCRADDVWLKRHPGMSLDERKARGRYRR